MLELALYDSDLVAFTEGIGQAGAASMIASIQRATAIRARQRSSSRQHCFCCTQRVVLRSKLAELVAPVPPISYECSVDVWHEALICKVWRSEMRKSALVGKDALRPVKTKSPVIEPELSVLHSKSPWEVDILTYLASTILSFSFDSAVCDGLRVRSHVLKG